MSRRKAILKDAGIYTASSYVAQLFDMVTGILVRRFLGPTNMGIWSFLQVVQNYAKHAGLGVTTATARDVPYFIGKGDLQKADEIKNLVFTFTTATSFLVALGMIIFAVFTRGRYGDAIYYGLWVVAALIILQRFYNLFITLLRSYKEFVFVGLLNIASSITSLILTLTLTWRFQLAGFFASMILNYILMLGWIFYKTPYRFSFSANWPAMVPILSLGLSMVVGDILRTILQSIDRIMITKYLGFEELGFYSVALMASNYLYSIPNMLSIVFFPHFQEVYGKSDDHNDLKKFLREPTLCLAYLFPFLIGFIWLSSSWIIPIILPQYKPGILALQYLILGSFFVALTHAFTSFILTIKKHWNLVWLQGIAIVLGFGVTGLFIHVGWGIQGVAIAGALIALFQFFIFSFLPLKMVIGMRAMMIFYLQIFCIFTYMLFALFIINHLFAGMGESFGKVILEYGAYALILSPFLFLAEKEGKVLSTLKTILVEFLEKHKKAASS